MEENRQVRLHTKEMKYNEIVSDVWRAVITVGQWQDVLTRRLREGALVFLYNRLI